MTDTFDLQGRVAIVTGGAGSLGTTFAHALASRGAHVILGDVDAAGVKARAADVAARHGVAAVGVEADVSDPAAVDRLIAASKTWGRIDVLVNNAAAQPPGFADPLERYSLDVWNRVVAVNLTGMFLCAKAAAPLMERAGAGSLINVASIYGMVAPDFRIYESVPFTTPAVYAATKAGVLGLTRYLATYWAAKKIRVNALTPGGVFRDHPGAFAHAYASRVPLGRMAKNEDLTGALLYLASDASLYVTGQNLVVDGGWTTW